MPAYSMDLVHSTTAHAADYRHYGLDLNRNHYHRHESQHNAYWQWQHSDGSSSDGFHQQSINNGNQWDASSPPQPKIHCAFGGPQSPLFRPKIAPERNYPDHYNRYLNTHHTFMALTCPNIDITTYRLNIRVSHWNVIKLTKSKGLLLLII